MKNKNKNIQYINSISKKLMKPMQRILLIWEKSKKVRKELIIIHKILRMILPFPMN